MSKTNYHTHTARCKHADGGDEDYVRSALAAGFSLLGFADHGPLPFENGYISDIRMKTSALANYTASIHSLRDAYSDSITICCGAEYEYFPAFLPYIADLLDSGALEYIILGNHFDLDERTGMYFGHCSRPEHVAAYARRTVQGMETGLYAYVAHPDLFLHSYAVFDEAARQASLHLCKSARALGIPLEYNLFGLEKQRQGGAGGLGYPCHAFWEIAAQEGCTAIIGVDGHRPEAMLTPDYATALDMLHGMGIVCVDRIRKAGEAQDVSGGCPLGI